MLPKFRRSNFFIIPGKRREKKKKKKSTQHTPHSTLPNSRKNGAFSAGSRDTCPRAGGGAKGCLQAAGRPRPHRYLRERAAGALFTPPNLPSPPSSSIKSRGGKLLPEEGAKKVATWMNEPGLRAPGAGPSLKSEKEKSRFLTGGRCGAAVVRATARHAAGAFIERTVPGGRQARAAAEAGRRRAAAAPGSRQLRDDGSGADAGACPPGGFPRAPRPALPRPAAREAHPPAASPTRAHPRLPRARGLLARGPTRAPRRGRPPPARPRPRPPPALREGRGAAA